MLLLKVCGMNNHDNLVELAKLEPDFIGLIFHESSPRNVSISPLIPIPESIKKVGVFVNKSIDFILEKAEEFQLDFIQLHGKETPDFCKEIQSKGFKTIKVFSVDESFDFNTTKPYEGISNYFLFDTKGKLPGGNGVAFDWNVLDKYKGETSFLLSGGINESDAKSISNLKHPKLIGIDINSGFEIEPGLKDILKIKTFYHELLSR